jgi:hypothetical protein
MILVWDNIKSFQRHLEDMKLFRRGHKDSEVRVAPKMFKDMPVPMGIKTVNEARLHEHIYSEIYELEFVPLWDVSLPKNSHN